MKSNAYAKIKFLKSSAKISQLPEDIGCEVAFVGRSNAGKSSALNVLTGINNLAKVSRTPGRTQLINLFVLENPDKRLVDLPGYGYAKVSISIKEKWQETLSLYLTQRKSLKGLILLMDIRHPLKDLDCMMVDWATSNNLPVHILLTKSDKLNYGQRKNVLQQVINFFKGNDCISVQIFSSLKKEGVNDLIKVLDQWFKNEE